MNQEKLYHLFENSTTAIVIFEAQGGIQYLNLSSLQLLACKKDQIYHQPFSVLLPTSLHRDFHAFITSQQKSFYRSQIQPHGSALLSAPADFSIQRLSSQSIRPTLYIASIYPIYSNEAIAPLPKDIEKGKSSPDIKHLLMLLKKEIDIPITALTTLVDRLLRMQPRSDQLPLLQNMHNSSHQLHHIIDQILLYANLLYEHIQPDSQPFSLHHVLKEVETAFQVQAKQQGIDFKLLKDDDIPPILLGDANLLSLILTSLLEHTLISDFTTSLRLHVFLETKIASNLNLRFSITVNHTHPSLYNDNFEMLKQAQIKPAIDQPSEPPGLAFSIVSQLAKQIGGTLLLGSDKKVDIHLTLPFALMNNELDEKDVNLTTEKVLEARDLHGLNVLYVDDVIPNHFLMEGLCAVWHVNLDTALNGQEALDKIQYNLYDVILMDLQMPIMDGYEASLRIRQANHQQNSSVPIIAISGSASDDIIMQIKAYGMNHFIPKPIRPDELYQKLSEFISS